MTTIRERTLSIFAKFDRDVAKIENSTMLADDLQFDSLDVVEFIMRMEDEFGVSIADGTYERVRTVGDLIALAENAVAGKAVAA